MRPHRRQPTRLPHPWDSPGKNTGVGCQDDVRVKTVGVSETFAERTCPWISLELSVFYTPLTPLRISILICISFLIFAAL